MYRIILLGAPGAGKGTQADLLTQKLNIAKISTGDMLRLEVVNNTLIGEQVVELINAGKLVPDALILSLIKQRITAADCQHGFLFDGFPRNIAQAEILWQSGIDVDYIIQIDVPDQIIIDRLTGRRVHLSSGRSYHTEFNPPKIAGIDDLTGEPLIQREDDKLDTVKKRLEIYHAQTKTLLAWYQNKAQYHGKAKCAVISGLGEVNIIHQQLVELIK